MKQNNRLLHIGSLLSICMLILSPLAVGATGEQQEPAVAASVVITEIQTGAKGADDEFVEIYNASPTAVDIAGWQICYSTGSSASKLATLGTTPAAPLLLPPSAYYTVKNAGAAADIGADQTYVASTKLTKTDKRVFLAAASATNCTGTQQDAVAWAAISTTTIIGEGTPLDPAPSGATNTDKLLERHRDALGQYVDTGDNAFDFALLPAGTTAPVVPGATPGADNGVDAEGNIILPEVFLAQPGPTPDPGSQPDPDSPPVDPNPVPDPGADSTPQSDPNPAPEQQDPQGSDAPVGGSADDPQSPAPEPNEGLVPPLVTELLPDPGAPQTDAADEYVELYNPNDASFNLSGYVLEAGTITKHKFIFPEDAVLSPHAYAAVFSADTHLSLSNSGGQVDLLDPTGVILGQTDEYPAAKESQAWALIGGIWQWTTLPTPNAENVPSPPAVARVASATTKAKTTKAKTTKMATAKVTKSKATKPSAAETPVQDLAAISPVTTPLHPGVLALIAVSAVLYGAYEYRRDVANRIYQFRADRAARRALRRSAEGR